MRPRIPKPTDSSASSATDKINMDTSVGRRNLRARFRDENMASPTRVIFKVPVWTQPKAVLDDLYGILDVLVIGIVVGSAAKKESVLGRQLLFGQVPESQDPLAEFQQGLEISATDRIGTAVVYTVLTVFYEPAVYGIGLAPVAQVYRDFAYLVSVWPPMAGDIGQFRKKAFNFCAQLFRFGIEAHIISSHQEHVETHFDTLKKRIVEGEKEGSWPDSPVAANSG